MVTLTGGAAAARLGEVRCWPPWRGGRVSSGRPANTANNSDLGQGASADVFASADTTQMDNARKSGAVTGQDKPFAGNRLILITPKDNPANISSVKDLASDGVKFVTAQPSVPIGTYTAQMLDKANADPSFGSDFKSKVMANTVSQEDNVRQVVSKVQLGEADAAIVYSTDATPQVRDQLNIIQVPDALQTLATYPIAVAKGNNSTGGEAFVAYVLGPDGQATLKKWGFLPPPQTSASAPAHCCEHRLSAGARRAALGAGAAAASAPIPSVASATFAPKWRSRAWSARRGRSPCDDLKQLPAETVNVSFQAGQGTTTASFTGTRLLNVFDAAGRREAAQRHQQRQAAHDASWSPAPTATRSCWAGASWTPNLAPRLSCWPMPRMASHWATSRAWRAWSCLATSAAAATSRPSRASTFVIQARHSRSAR